MRRQREQNGHLYRRGGWWVLRYREIVNQGGELKTMQPAEQLFPVDANHKTKKSVRESQEFKDRLRAINERKQVPETVVTLGQFVESTYLPHVREHKRPSTDASYQDVWTLHLKARVDGLLLRDVRTVDVQNWLEAIAVEDRHPTRGTKLARATLKNIKNVLSAIFSLAKQRGYLDSINPVQGTAVPKAAETADTYAYSLEEIARLLMLIPEPATTIIATAAFTGLRRGEIQGMVWENLNHEHGTKGQASYMVDRSIWEGQTTEPKTKASKARIPIIDSLASMLESHRERLGNPQSGPIFPASNGQPLALNNVLTRQIKPALDRCVFCKKPRTDHADHSYKRDPLLPAWHGWHAFRRGLATNLNRLGVQDKTIQAILRHANLSTTMNVYVKAVDADSAAAMNALDALMCAGRAPGAAVFPPARVN